MSSQAAPPHSTPRDRGMLRPALIVTCAAALTIVVALGTRGIGGGRAIGVPAPPVASWRVVAGILAGLAGGVALAGLAVVAASMYAGWGRRGKDPLWWSIEPPQTHWAVKLAILVLALAMAAGAVAGVLWLTPGSSRAPAQATSPGGPSTQVAKPAQGSFATGPSPIPIWALGAGAFGALGLTVWVLGTPSRRVHRRAEVARTEASTQDIALNRAIEILTDEPDPRRAVIAAYAAMEQLLARAGAARHPAEAPLEYVARNPLLQSTGRAAARRLSELFEAAKFSLHAVDESTRTRALFALQMIRSELAE